MPRPMNEGTVPWPGDLVKIYQEAGYWEGLSVGEQIWEQADRHPARIALVDGLVRLTYADLVGRADAGACRLKKLGLRRGDRLLVQLPNGWGIVVLTLACLRAGIVPAMALPGHRQHELAYLAEHSEATAIAVPDTFRGFDHQELAETLRRDVPSLRHVLVAGEAVNPGNVSLEATLSPSQRPDLDREVLDANPPAPQDVCLFLLSGGTTGLPKLIARTHDDYVYNAKCSAEVSALDEDSVYLVVLPAGHNFPLACPGLLGTFLVGGRVVMLRSPEPTSAFATIEAEKVSHTAVVPAVAQSWLEHRSQAPDTQQLATLQVLQVGGARLPDEIARRVRPELDCTLQQVFGMAEGLLNYTRLDDPDDVIVGTQGRPISAHDEVLLVDEFDNPVPDGAPGSLLTRGPYTPRGYYRAAEHNLRSFTPDGWYRSGDICRWHESGNLVVEGRDKDMINRAGEKISAEEVENLVYQLPSVERVAAVAMPDERLGERVCLYVVLRAGSGLALDDVRDSLIELGVAAYKLPERLVVVDRIPETKVGKIDKKALRADIAARLQDDLATSTS